MTEKDVSLIDGYLDARNRDAFLGFKRELPVVEQPKERREPIDFIDAKPSFDEFFALAKREGVGVLLNKAPQQRDEHPIAVSIRRRDPAADVPDYTVLDFITGETIVLKPFREINPKADYSETFRSLVIGAPRRLFPGGPEPVMRTILEYPQNFDASVVAHSGSDNPQELETLRSLRTAALKGLAEGTNKPKLVFVRPGK